MASDAMLAGDVEPTNWERIRQACAKVIQPCCIYEAAGGSQYIRAGSITIRISDHSNTSRNFEVPTYNFLNTDIDDLPRSDINKIIRSIRYPRLAKKTIVAKHLGITVPKLKTLFTSHDRSEVYEDVCESEFYRNTFTEFVKVDKALDLATKQGIKTRLPIEI